MKKRGRSTDSALLRTIANKKMQTFSHKRLMRDLQEIEKEKIPTVGVTARPLEEDLFTWHANIRGPEGTPYQGGVFHLEMKFPQSYPHHPPTVSLFNTIPHPNVFGNYICLDMITQNGNREEGVGWSSAYSAQSILTQLQSFLFEETLSENKEKSRMQILQAVKQANAFNCCRCKHGGKLSCWPSFSNKENKEDEYKILKSENEIVREQLTCFHTKLPFTDNQLGLGLRISKIPRTGNIREAETFYDYVSIKAFIKESINRTSANERITHWMPVYFGKGDNEQRFLKFLFKAISMIMTNSTRNFDKLQILEVLPKLLITSIYHIMDEKKHASIRQIRIITHIHSIFLLCLIKYPELKANIANTHSRFIESEAARVKDNQPNLGAILGMLTGSDAHKFADISEAYFQEQLDRQVLWILKSVPELLDETLDEDADAKRAAIVFKSQKTSFHIFCFYKLFITEVCEQRKSRDLMWEEYSNNLCKLTNQEETHIQNRIMWIQNNVNTFEDFFAYTGIKKREDLEVTEMLKQAIKNSERKKYHGEFESLHELPNSQDQFQKILANIPKYQRFITVARKLSGDKKKTTLYEISEKKSSDEEWKQMCSTRWAWVKEALVHEKTLDARQVSAKALDYSKEGILKPQDRLLTIIRDKYLQKEINYGRLSVAVPPTSWKQLFLRLDLEDFLIYFDMNPDFESFYEKLQVCQANSINTLLVPMIEVNKIKSGYYYLTSLLTKLTAVKHIEFSGLPQGFNIKEKAAKALKKGFRNFIEGSGRLETLVFHNLIANRDYSDFFFEYLTESNHLTSIRFQNTNLLVYGNAMKVMSNSLISKKGLQEIILNECKLNEEKCKVLADVLMRTKGLKIFEIHNGAGLNNGLSSIIYNLAFSPSLEVLDISRTASNIAETIVSLYKMLRISTSIQILDMRSVGGLNQRLDKEFWNSIGENKSLRVLDISLSGDVSNKKVMLGNSIGFNAKKKGVLEYINLTGCISREDTINQIYQGMCISDYDEERIYGDPNKANKMIPANHPKVFYNNLKALQFNCCNNLNPNFNLSDWNKRHNKVDPSFVQLLARSPKLVSASFQRTSMNKNMGEILALSLDPRRPNFLSTIKVLNLSQNFLGKEGIKALAEVFQHNNILEVLDLSKNQMGVSGAFELAIALRNNTSLKFLNLFNNKIGYDGAKTIAENVVGRHAKLEALEIGHNRIRDKGLKAITEALIAHKKSLLKILGLRFNFITNVGATYFFNKVTNTGLEEVFLRNNLIDDLAINNLDQIKSHEQSSISIDVLEKIKYLDTQRMERSIWIHPIDGIAIQNLKRFFEITYKCGIVIDVRLRRARKYPNRMGNNYFAFVEFADVNSVNRALHLASKKLTTVDSIRFRVYRAGTGTFIYTKKTAKQKKIEAAKKSLPPVPYGIASVDLARGAMRLRGRRGGRGGRGMGRGRGRK